MPYYHTTKGDQRRAAFLAVATRLFLEKGFDGVSVNEIVRQAGGSLATLYAYFPTKRDLFIAIANGDGLGTTLTSLDQAFDHLPVRDTLMKASQEFIARVGNPELISMFRMMISAVPRFREEVRAFMLERRSYAVSDFHRYFARQCDLGTLRIADPEFAAVQFLSLIRGPWSVETLCGADEFFDAAYLDKVVTEGVETFLARFGVPERTAPTPLCPPAPGSAEGAP